LVPTQANHQGMEGPDGASIQAKAIVTIPLSSTSTFSFLPILALPRWIVYVLIGFARAAVAAVITLFMLKTRRKGQGPVGPTA